MKIAILGATGTVGGEVVREAIKDPAFDEVAAVVRRPLDIEHPKLKIVQHQNYLDYSNLKEIFKNSNACIWCLGISQSQVNEQKYMEITYDYTLAAAKAMLEANPDITFLFLSGAGADPSEQSKTLFARGKGKAENALQTLPFKKLYIVRPAGIQPIHINKNTALINKILAPVYPLLKLVAPSLVISSAELAKAMLYILKNGYGKTIIENAELKQIAFKRQNIEST